MSSTAPRCLVLCDGLPCASRWSGPPPFGRPPEEEACPHSPGGSAWLSSESLTSAIRAVKPGARFAGAARCPGQRGPAAAPACKRRAATEQDADAAHAGIKHKASAPRCREKVGPDHGGRVPVPCAPPRTRSFTGGVGEHCLSPVPRRIGGWGVGERWSAPAASVCVIRSRPRRSPRFSWPRTARPALGRSLGSRPAPCPSP